MSANPLPVSAPGKLFLLGEYAVLGGGPALVTSVDRKVHLRVRGDDDGYEVVGADFDDPLHLPMLVARVLRELEGLDVDFNGVTVDVSEFFRQDTKLGIGSSAASTAALVASAAPELSVRRRFEIAWEVHRRLQGGVGSGADIAVSTFGGPLAFHLKSSATSGDFDNVDCSGLSATADAIRTEQAVIDSGIELPNELRIDAVWTGQRADSVSFVTGVTDALGRSPQQVSAILRSLASRSRVGINAARKGDADTFVDAIRKADRTMEQLGDATGLPIITDTHRRIRALAHTTQAVAKPSGAGGGDFTLLVGPADAPVPPPIEDDYFMMTVA